jgi:hypothetical protein
MEEGEWLDNAAGGELQKPVAVAGNRLSRLA